MKKRRNDMDKINEIIVSIIWEMPLPEHCRPYILSGNWEGLWECHIKGNWILVYDINTDIKKVSFERTGTHADLFK